jgi:hypothetical protein
VLRKVDDIFKVEDKKGREDGYDRKGDDEVSHWQRIR